MFHVKRSWGFSLIELLLGLMLLSIAAATILYQLQLNSSNNQAKYLSGETSAYANVFANYIYNNESSLVAASESIGTFGVSYNTLQNLGYTNGTGLTEINKFGQKPCLLVIGSTNESAIPLFVLVYLGVESKIMPTGVIKNASVLLGSGGGYIESDYIAGVLGSWALQVGFNEISGCGNDGIAKHSVAFNLNMSNKFHDLVLRDLSLNRNVDAKHVRGTIGNKNTMSTDIVLDSATQNNALVFNGTNSNIDIANGQRFLQESNNLVMESANVVAKYLQATQAHHPGDLCNANQIGEIVAWAPSINDNMANRSNLVCTFDPMACDSDSNICFLPIVDNTIRMVNNVNAHTPFKHEVPDYGWLTNNYTCPSSVSLMTDGQYNKEHLSFDWVSCNGACSPFVNHFDATLGILYKLYDQIDTSTGTYGQWSGAVVMNTVNADCNGLCSQVVKPYTYGISSYAPFRCNCYNGRSMLSAKIYDNVVSTGGNIRYVTCSNRSVLEQASFRQYFKK